MKYQPRYAAYLKTTAAPTNWDFMAFIARMKKKFLAGTGEDTIQNHDEFTAFIEAEVERKPEQMELFE